jgi:hypothetical protein
VGTLTDLLGGAKEDLPEVSEVPDDASSIDAGAGDELPADPAPSRSSRRGRSRGSRASRTAQKATHAEQNQVRDALAMLLTVPAWALQMKDPHCGGAVMDNRDEIIKSMVPIVCRNPAMLAFFTAANAPWMDYLALATALRPVISTIWGHHVSHIIGQASPEQDGGGLVDLSRYTA